MSPSNGRRQLHSLHLSPSNDFILITATSADHHPPSPLDLTAPTNGVSVSPPATLHLPGQGYQCISTQDPGPQHFSRDESLSAPHGLRETYAALSFPSSPLDLGGSLPASPAARTYLPTISSPSVTPTPLTACFTPRTPSWEPSRLLLLLDLYTYLRNTAANPSTKSVDFIPGAGALANTFTPSRRKTPQTPSADASVTCPSPRPVATKLTLTSPGDSFPLTASRPFPIPRPNLNLSTHPSLLPRYPRPLPNDRSHLFALHLPLVHLSSLTLLFPTILLRTYLPLLCLLQSDPPPTPLLSQRLTEQQSWRARLLLIAASSTTPICLSQTGCSFEADTYLTNSGPIFTLRNPSTVTTTAPFALAASLRVSFVAAHNDFRYHYASPRRPEHQLRRPHRL